MQKVSYQTVKSTKLVHPHPPHVKITGKSFHIKFPLKQLILEKASALPSCNAAKVHVVISLLKDKRSVEVHTVVSLWGETYQTKVQHSNPFTAVISAFKKIRIMTHKHQEIRLNTRKHFINHYENSTRSR